MVIKPSEFTSALTLEFVKLFAEAGFPPGVVNVVTGFGDAIREYLQVKSIWMNTGAVTANPFVMR